MSRRGIPDAEFPHGSRSALRSVSDLPKSPGISFPTRACQGPAFPQLKSNRRPGQPSKQNLTEAVLELDLLRKTLLESLAQHQGSRCRILHRDSHRLVQGDLIW